MTHSFVLQPRAKMPVIPRNIFHGQNAKLHLNSMSSFKKKCWIIIVVNILLPHDFSLFVLSLVLWYILNSPFQNQGWFQWLGHCMIIFNFFMFLLMNLSDNFLRHTLTELHYRKTYVPSFLSKSWKQNMIFFYKWWHFISD